MNVQEAREYLRVRRLTMRDPTVRCIASVDYTAVNSGQCLIRKWPGSNYCWHHIRKQPLRQPEKDHP